MTISGGIKFFDKSKCLKKDGASVAVSTGSGGDNVLSANRYVRWDSVGSDDSTTETLTVTFPSSTTFNRLLLVGMNAKDFRVFYDTSTEFSNVVSLDDAPGTINIADWDEDTAYFEFDEVTADNIKVELYNTQVADVEKFVEQIIVTSEIGTLEGYPRVRASIDSNEQVARTQNNKRITQKSFETFDAKLTMSYTSQSDLTVLNTLFEKLEPFLVWLCGGRYGSQYFSAVQKNWRLKDVYQVQASGKKKTDWDSNTYVNAPETNLDLYEEV